MCDQSCAASQCYTLHYFNARGRGEIIRYMFVFAKMPYNDHRMTQDEWAQFKPKAPLGQVPLLECNKEGKSQFLCQSGAIIRHVAFATGLIGKNPYETARADEAFESLKEVLEAGGKVMFEKDPARKEELMQQLKTEVAPRIFGFLEKRLVDNGGKNLAGGEGYTYADLFVAQFLDSMAKRPMMDMAMMAKNFPNVVALAKNINESPEIAAYLAKRPESEF